MPNVILFKSIVTARNTDAHTRPIAQDEPVRCLVTNLCQYIIHCLTCVRISSAEHA